MIILTEVTKDSGVYRIVNNLTGFLYIGSSSKIKTRLQSHRNMLKDGIHDNTLLQRSWNKNGETAFTFEQIIPCDLNNLISTEQWWIDYYRNNNINLYNIRLIAESNRGYKFSDKSKARMSEAKKNISEETRKKMSDSAKKYIKENIEVAMARFRNRKGIKLSEEQKSKLRVPRPSRIGMKYPHPSKESREKMSKAHIGIKSRLGHINSKEHNKKISIANKNMWGLLSKEEKTQRALYSWEKRKEKNNDLSY